MRKEFRNNEIKIVFILIFKIGDRIITKIGSLKVYLNFFIEIGEKKHFKMYSFDWMLLYK